MYLMLGTRPDIAYAVGRFACFAHDPSKDRFKAVGCIFAYINTTKDFAIEYIKSVDTDIDPYGTSDADYGGELATAHRRKSTSDYAFSLASGLFSWSSKLQENIATSTMEAEYLALYKAGKHAVWIQNIYEGIGFPLQNPLYVWCNNQAAIAVAKKEGTHEAQKHIDIKFHYTQELVETQKIKVNYIASKHNESDILTKALTGKKFASALDLLGLVNSRDFIDSFSSTDSSPLDTLQESSSVLVYVDAHE